jgi:hypothetical protein
VRDAKIEGFAGPDRGQGDKRLTELAVQSIAEVDDRGASFAPLF